jgi:hypothetical protein
MISSLILRLGIKHTDLERIIREPIFKVLIIRQGELAVHEGCESDWVGV